MPKHAILKDGDGDEDETFGASDDEMHELSDDSEEDRDQCAAGHNSRLSGFKRPKIGNAGYALVNKLKKTKSKNTGKGRNFGKLAQLMDMPLDVVFEIAARLQPLDILHLCRVSKRFRSTFASRTSRHIWVAARRNVHDFPDCPSDLTELQFASLMFEHDCQACGASRAPKIDYSLRIRFCGACFTSNVQKGSALMKPYPKIPSYILTLLPRSMLKTPHIYTSGRAVYGDIFQNSDNGRQNSYYTPEFEMVVKRYQALASNPSALTTFVEQQKTLASQMMKDAAALGAWVTSSRCQKIAYDKECMENRQADIEKKFIELGWETKDFLVYDRQWNSLLRQPRELTPRIWKQIRPKLEAMLEAKKDRDLKRAFQIRFNIRCSEFGPFWNAFVAAIQDPVERSLMPNISDACDMPAIKAMLSEDDAQIPISEQRWLAMVDLIPSQVEKFHTDLKRNLVCLITNGAPWYLVTKMDAREETSDGCDLSILAKATSLFTCKSARCNQPIGYPALFTHSHMKNLVWSQIHPTLEYDKIVEPTVNMVLKAVGLPEDTSLTTMEELDGRLVCLCGHPQFRKPMTFRSLIRHILNENELCRRYNYETQEKQVEYYNDHSITSTVPFVALLPDGEAACDGVHEPSAAGDSSKAEDSKFPVNYQCKYCYKLRPIRCYLESRDEVAYHMKAKHHIDFESDAEAASNYAKHQLSYEFGSGW